MIDDRIYRFCHDRRLREEGRYPPRRTPFRFAPLRPLPQSTSSRVPRNSFLAGPSPLPVSEGGHASGRVSPFLLARLQYFYRIQKATIPASFSPTSSLMDHVSPCRASFQRENTRHRTDHPTYYPVPSFLPTGEHPAQDNPQRTFHHGSIILKQLTRLISTTDCCQDSELQVQFSNS